MKLTFKTLGLLLLCLSVLLASSCALFITNDVFDGGEPLDSAKMSEIRSEVFGSNEPTISEEQLSETESETSKRVEEESGIVYWTSGGKVWHAFENCGHLKGSKEILSGSVDEAQKAGKEKLCSSCEKKKNN